MARLVLLIRHGESEWNLRKLTQGQTPHPALTDRGRDQAGAAARTLLAALRAEGRVADVVLTSDLVRAAQTAEIVGDALGCPVRSDARLREQHLGNLQGRSHEETFAVAADLDWTVPDAAVPGGETREAVRDRMLAVLADLPPDAVAVVVSHGDAIRPLLTHLAGHEQHAGPWIEVPNGSLARLEDPDAGRWVLASAPAAPEVG